MRHEALEQGALAVAQAVAFGFVHDHGQALAGQHHVHRRNVTDPALDSSHGFAHPHLEALEAPRKIALHRALELGADVELGRHRRTGGTLVGNGRDPEFVCPHGQGNDEAEGEGEEKTHAAP